MKDSINFVDPRADTALTLWLRNVYGFYLHDLSQYDPHGYRLSPSGRWEPDHLPYWLEHSFCHPLILIQGAIPVGFAFVGEAPFPFMSPGVRFRLSEFFVLRACRRSGIGRTAALAIFAHFPGSFELTVFKINAPALTFWRSILPQVASDTPMETHEPDIVRFTFTTGRAGDR